MNDLFDTLPRSVQTHFYCTACSQLYEKEWIREKSACLFCMTDPQGQRSRKEWIREAEWVFLQSGWDSMVAFYDAYFSALHRWCDRKQIPFTLADVRTELDQREEAKQQEAKQQEAL
jgi:hypothetical protein